MKIAVYLFLSATFLTCKKNADDVTVPYSEASYKVIVTMNWKGPQFAVPAGAHVTGLIGMVHSKDTFLWMPGKRSTMGLEDVAEIGNNIRMNTELDAIVLNNKAISKFTISPPTVAGTVETNLTFNTNHPFISFASMIAPSPDWFMGIHDFSLLNNTTWKTDVTLEMSVYDAGTEDGDVFDYNNPASMPQQNIALLTPLNGSALARGNPSVSPIGTIRFVKN